ncbi:PD-(D/E)XK nuclease family protein [Mariniflexile jejuense]|uniref:PD-(D/E)XK nuclease family protein n=1 Tax=Mariniflexile jejuense TaxID=1173582 RepID=A0ABW3JMQ5_9FLAO
MSVTSQDLESFEAACESDLLDIKESLNAFNIFNVLGIQYREIRHSNFLGWLFSPNESHQLGDVFLRSLLTHICKVIPSKHTEVSALLDKNLSDTQVYRESVHNIDILIVNEKLGFVITIENKIFSGYSAHQLEKYFEFVEDNYKLLQTKIYLTLTPFESNGHLCLIKGDRFTNINYKQIVGIIECNQTSIHASKSTVKESISQYIAMVQKDITKTSKEVALAREIYKKYKKEIDFIISNQEDFTAQKAVIMNAIKDGELGDFEIIENEPHPEIIRILPNKEALKNIFRDARFNSWNGDYMFCLELFFQKNVVWLKWCFGDIKNDDNREAYQLIKTNMVTTMNSFNCFKIKGIGIDFHLESPEESYKGICVVPLFNDVAYYASDKPFLELYKTKFEEINKVLIQPWVQECLAKL